MKKKKLKTLLARERRRKRAPRAKAPASTPAEPKRATLRVSQAAVARARRRPASKPTADASFFAPYAPPKFVTGGAMLAMDESSRLIVQWTGAGSIAFNQGYSFQGYQELALLAQIPEYRRISEVMATEMTRKWIKLSSVSEDEGKAERIKELETELKRLGVQDAFRKLAELDGFFGRSHLYLDTGKGDDRPELKTSLGTGRDETTKAKFKKGDLKRIAPIEPVWTYPSNYNANDPLSPDWYKPTMWFVMGKELHVTRLLCFIGREVPDLVKPAFSFGGLSLSQMAKPYVDNWLRTRQSVSDILHSFSVMVLSTDLQTSLQADGDQLDNRLNLFIALRDNKGVMAINKDSEDFKNVSAPLGTLDMLQAQSQEHMAAVSGIPIVKLLGIQPAGLNASSEGEIRTFYDWIHACQEKFFTPNLKTVIDFAQMNIWGEVDEDIGFTYEPLWSLDAKTLADLRKLDIEALAELVDRGIISLLEARVVLAGKPDSDFAGLDVDDVPETEEEIEPKNIHEKVDGAENDKDGPGAPHTEKMAA